FDTLVESAARLCRADQANLARVAGDRFLYVAAYGFPPGYLEHMQAHPRPIDRGSASGRAVLTGGVVHIEEVLATSEFTLLEAQELGHCRTMLAIPLLREGTAIGALFLTRPEVEPFTQNQIQLLQTFADQAVIAIENVRLFDEVKARTRELSESLEQQTATSEILKVISSSPTDTQPVFDAIVQSGLNLFPDAAISIILPIGDPVHTVAIADSDPERVKAWKGRFPDMLSRDRMHGAAILDRRFIDIPDAREHVAGPFAPGVKNFLASGYRAITIMPMIRGEAAIGAISVIRPVPGPLSEKQNALLRTFADQAVIAIENVRLFNELRESLEQQTATSEVLGVISS